MNLMLFLVAAVSLLAGFLSSFAWTYSDMLPLSFRILVGVLALCVVVTFRKWPFKNPTIEILCASERRFERVVLQLCRLKFHHRKTFQYTQKPNTHLQTRMVTKGTRKT